MIVALLDDCLQDSSTHPSLDISFISVISLLLIALRILVLLGGGMALLYWSLSAGLLKIFYAYAKLKKGLIVVILYCVS